VYSIAVLCDAMGLEVELLGSDVNAAAIESARRAIYGPWATRDVPAAHRGVLTGTGPAQQIVGRIRQQAQFTVHNLLEPPPRSTAPGGKWDLVVCRNVLIYLSQTHSARVLARLQEALAPGATLVLGASDILAELPAGLAARQIAGRVVFQHLADTEPFEGSQRRHPSKRAPALQSPLPLQTHDRQDLVAGLTPTKPSTEDGDEKEAVSQLLEGIARHLAGDLQEAVARLRAALYLMPGLWPASYYLALTYDGLGRSQEARREYAHASRSIEQRTPLPVIDGHDFSFLQRDIAHIARGRAHPP
jgi:chemotaxis protein methyltransferase CheR